MNGKVVAIYIAPAAGAPMESRSEVEALAGAGLRGDRYASGDGAFSKPSKEVRHVTLIDRDAIAAANATLTQPFSEEETRRNIVTEGVDLNVLVGKEFSVGPVRMRGVELADPCKRPSKLAGKDGFKEAFDMRGGLRAEILRSGTIMVGDAFLPG